MKILVIIPWVASEDFIKYHKGSLPSDVEVMGLKEGPVMVNDIASNLRGLIDAIREAEKQEYNAVVVGCLDDPGIQIAREFVTIPVLGPLNVALHVSQMIGHKTLLLAPEIARTRFQFREIIATYGLEDKVVIRGAQASPPEGFQAYKDYMATGKINTLITDVTNICVSSIEKDGVDVIVIGCGGLKWMKEVLEVELKRKGYSITIIAPIALTVEVAKTLIAQKLSHNRIGYPGRRDMSTSRT